MVIDSESQDTRRPYAPASNVIAVLQRLRSRNMPDRVDNDYLLDAGISESLVQRVYFALEFLDLVEGGMPTPHLRSIATSTDEEFRDILAGLLRDAYSDVLSVVDPAVDSQERIVNVFRRFTPASQRDRMVSFFLAMSREAGIPVMEAPRHRAMGDSKKVTRPQGTRATASKGTPASGSQVEPPAGRIERNGKSFPPAVQGLIEHLPAQGESWSAVDRQNWLNFAAATLAFAYPEPEASTAVGRLVNDGDGDMT